MYIHIYIYIYNVHIGTEGRIFPDFSRNFPDMYRAFLGIAGQPPQSLICEGGWRPLRGSFFHLLLP